MTTAIGKAIRVKILIGALLSSQNATAQVVELSEALAQAYLNYEGFKVIQEEFLTEIEAFPKALSRFLPNIHANVAIRNSNREIVWGEQKTAQQNANIQHGISIEQEIFNGGGSVLGLKIAQDIFGLARNKLYEQEQVLILRAIKIYLNQHTAHQIYLQSKKLVESNNKQLKAISSRYRSGQATKIDVANAEVGLANALYEQAKRLEEYERIKAESQTVFQYPTLTTIWPTVSSSVPTSLADLKKIIFAKNYELNKVKTGVAFRKNNANMRLTELLPKAVMRAYFGHEHSFDNRDVQSHNRELSLIVNIPILHRGGAEYSEIRRVKKEARKELFVLNETIKKIEVLAISAWERYKVMNLRSDFARQGLQAVMIAVEGTNKGFAIGEKNIIDVLRAEDELYTAEVRKIEADKDKLVNAYEMRLLMGSLTANNLGLKVKYFSPDKEYSRIKLKVIGF